MANKQAGLKTDESSAIEDALVHLARLSLSGREQDAAVLVQRLARRFRQSRPELSETLTGMLREAPTRSSPLRRQSSVPLPVDGDTRLALVRVEDPPVVDHQPILRPEAGRQLDQLIEEHRRAENLAKEDLAPSRTALLVGPPGVGKTMTARWIAASLGLPLLLLDLSAVMSSLLGRTGVNLRHVLDYGKTHECVLLIDELDSIGKRRNDDSDVGELKRLVNVLLQQLDDWPAFGSLLLGATNHPELLDPALWRRFDLTVTFSTPDQSERERAIIHYSADELPSDLVTVVARVLDGMSYSEIESVVERSRRAAALGYGSVEQCLLDACADRTADMSAPARQELATALVTHGTSQRRAHELTGVSRDTIRKRVRSTS